VCFRGNNIYLYQGEVVSVVLNKGNKDLCKAVNLKH